MIQYEGDNNTFIWKHPVQNFNLGTQLIVHESQEAIFFRDGKALDLFGAGRYTLETGNLPFLQGLYSLPTNTVLKENSAKKFFYNLPIISLAYSGLIALFIAGGLCMLISPLPYYAAAIACAVILAVYIIAVVNAKTASGKLQAIDRETEIKTQLIAGKDRGVTRTYRIVK